jgi:hypothetical protein
MTKDEALRLALEALETCNWFDDGEYGHAEYDHVSTSKAITAIKEVLAQPEQKPVAIYRAGQAKGEVYHVQFLKGMEADEVLLYAAPLKRKPLTDEEIEKCYETTGHYQTLRPQDRFAVFALARAIEAAHNIKGEA